MQDKKLFSWKLCREGMRQVRLIGILTLVIVLVASVAVIVGEYLDALYWIELNSDMVDYSKSYHNSVAIYDVNPYILFTIFSVFIMVISLFGFMNKRNECDFYHSLPHTRLCVYLSLLASVLIWNVAIIAAGVSASAITIGILPYVEHQAAYLMNYICNAVAAVMLVSTTTVFAMTLTGTTLSNVIAAGIFLFVPRACMLVYVAMLSEALPFVPIAANSFLLDVDNNVLWGILAALMGEGDGFLTEWTTFGYSVLVAVLYAVAAAFMFVRRKSEAATKASINAGLQYVFRLIPAFLISLISIYGILTVYTDGDGFRDEDIFYLIIVYIVAVIAYFLYEAITTRKLKNLIKAIPGLIGLVVLNLVFLGALIGNYEKELNFQPEKDEVDFIYIKDDEDAYRANYFKTATEGIALSSDGIKEILTDCLKDTVDRWENSRYGVDSFYTYFYDDSTLWVTFVCDGKETDRKVIVNNSNYEKLKQAVAAETEYVNTFMDALINESEISFTELFNSQQYHTSIVNTFREELSTKSFGELYDLVYGGDNKNENVFYILARFDGKTGDYAYLDVTLDFPKTIAEYLNFINKQSEKHPIKAYVDDIKKVNLATVEYQDLNLNIVIKTIRNGVVVQTEYYNMYSYYSGGEGTTHSDEKLEKLETLAGLMDIEHEFSEADFAGEVKIAQVDYYVYREDEFIELSTESVVGASADKIVCVEYKSDNGQGYFVIDEEIHNLIKEIDVMEDTQY